MSAIGQIPHRVGILNITNSYPCTITTDEEHGFSTGNEVRLTQLNGAMPIKNGIDELNNGRFKIVVTGVDTFYIKDPISDEKIDSTLYVPYAQGGSCNRIEQTFYYYGITEEIT